MKKWHKWIICISALVLVSVGTVLGFVLPQKLNDTKLEFSLESVELSVGEEKNLQYHATDGANVTFASSNSEIASITDNKIKAVSAGTATITGVAYLKGKTKSATCTVTVRAQQDPDTPQIIPPLEDDEPEEKEPEPQQPPEVIPPTEDVNDPTEQQPANPGTQTDPSEPGSQDPTPPTEKDDDKNTENQDHGEGDEQDSGQQSPTTPSNPDESDGKDEEREPGDSEQENPPVSSYRYKIEIKEDCEGNFDINSQTLYYTGDIIAFSIRIYDNEQNLVSLFSPQIICDDEHLSDINAIIIIAPSENGTITFNYFEINCTFTIKYQKI